MIFILHTYFIVFSLFKAHFHERRAEKHLKHHRYDEAIKCLEKSLYYIDEAYKTIQMPKAIEVLIVQEKEYKRQIQQIQLKKLCYENLKIVDEVSNDSNQSNEELINEQQCLKNSEDQVLLAIDKTMKEYDARFSLDKDNVSNRKEDKNENLFCGINNDELLEMELKVKEIPLLAPLELPSFDYKVFHRVHSEPLQSNKCDDNNSNNEGGIGSGSI